MRGFFTGIAAVVVSAVVLAAAPASPAVRSVTVTLSPVSATSVPQGDPFSFRAAVTAAEPFSKIIEFLVQPVGASASTQVPFEGAAVTLDAGASTELDEHVVTSQWFAGPGQYQVVAMTLDGVQVAAPLAFTVTRSRIQPAVFQDVTAKLGLATTVPMPLSCVGQSAGAAWGDVNGDGKLDLFLPRGNEPAELFINHGKRGFVDEARARGVAGDGTYEFGAAFADYNNDGSPDLYVTREGTDILYKNNGKGYFKDVTAAAGVGGGLLSHRAASWADYDNDGRLDLYVTDYGSCNKLGDPDLLFHNNGDGTFTDVSSLIRADYSATPDVGEGRGFQAGWFDYNGDGRQDLYLANDYFSTNRDHNRLWRNDGKGANGQWHFTDVSQASGAGIAINSMGLGIGDYNRDGRLDLAISNIGPNVLLRNNGNGTFTNVAGATGVEATFQQAQREAITWGTIFGDFNLDGWEDLYFASADIYPDRYAGYPPQRNTLLINDHGKRFLNLRAPSRSDDPGNSRGVSTADYDRDGRLDLLVIDQGGTPHLYRNVTPRGNSHWLEINTVGTVSNRDGCGARIVLTTKGPPMTREVFCGSVGQSSGSDKVVHFGLGPVKTVKKVTITWPSGRRQVLRKVRADRLLTITEPRR
jgi:enediyne biosynthesis protein E4